jgi:hypothetical protein
MFDRYVPSQKLACKSFTGRIQAQPRAGDCVKLQENEKDGQHKQRSRLASKNQKQICEPE